MADFLKMSTVAVAQQAAAIGVNMSINAQANVKLALPVETRKVLGEYLYKGNPVGFYTSKLKPTSKTKSSLQLEWTVSANKWQDKDDTVYGNGVTGNGTVYGGNGTKGTVDPDRLPVLQKETIYWNKSKESSEPMRESDLQRGAVNMLAPRMSDDFTKALIDGQKFMFELIAGQKTLPSALGAANAGSKDGKGIRAYGLDLTPTTGNTHLTVQERGAVLLKGITDAAIVYMNEFNLNKSDLLITIEPLHFNTLAFAGLLGNKVDKTFNGGMFTVASAGGFRFQSGDSMLPLEFKLAKGETISAGTDPEKAKYQAYLSKAHVDPAGVAADVRKSICMIGTADSVAYNHSIYAANIGNIGNTNDLESYLEYANCTAIPTRTKQLGLMAVMYEVDATHAVIADGSITA